MNDICLDGCTSTPLAGYLKALGVLRLLSVKYPDTRGFWRRDKFVLCTSLDREGIERFFLDDYEPTPIMAPWNGGSGFYEKDSKTALKAIQQSTVPRFAAYRACLKIAEQALKGMDRGASPKGDDKVALLARVRGLFPDDVLDWLDASVSLSGNSAHYPPLLGTGGNDGRLDFTNNFMQRLGEVFDIATGTPAKDSAVWLRTTLFGNIAAGLVKKAIGQFSPGQAGGPNSTSGFGGTSAESDARINPWDYILAIEGALTFGAAEVRRDADEAFGVLSYPFTVTTVGAGAGGLGVCDNDKTDARAEVWVPLWSHLATYAEIRALLAEGRVALGKKPARDALDFIRAVQRFGGYRGVHTYQRFGRLQRSGDNHLFSPLMRVVVNDHPQSRWLDDLDKHSWLDRFRRFAGNDNTANRFHVLRKRLEDALFALSGRAPSRADTQALLTLLGEIQFALSSSRKAKESVRPIPRLSDRWVIVADDGTPAFRIAKALAGLHGVGEEPLPLRAQLFPVHRELKSDEWMTPETGERVRIYSGQTGRLTDTLRALLERRLWLAEKLDMADKPLISPAGATLDDVAAFLRDGSMDTAIAARLPGLCLCEIPEDADKTSGDRALPAAFGLLKLALTPNRTLRSLGWLDGPDHLPIPGGMLAELASGNPGNRAVQTACRRLRASGLMPAFAMNDLPGLGNLPPLRAAGALLIPLRYGATGALARRALNTVERQTETTT